MLRKKSMWILDGIFALILAVVMAGVAVLAMAITTYFVGIFGGAAYEEFYRWKGRVYSSGDEYIGAGIIGFLFWLFAWVYAPSKVDAALACLAVIVIALVLNIAAYTLTKFSPPPPRPAGDADFD